MSLKWSGKVKVKLFSWLRGLFTQVWWCSAWVAVVLLEGKHSLVQDSMSESMCGHQTCRRAIDFIHTIPIWVEWSSLNTCLRSFSGMTTRTLSKYNHYVLLVHFKHESRGVIVCLSSWFVAIHS